MNTVAKTYQANSSRHSREEMILAHLSLVRHVVGRLTTQLPAGVDMENLEAAGMLGLVEAANRFDPEREAKFETFAAWRIRGAVLDELRRNCPFPQHLLEKMAKVRQAYQQLTPPIAMEAIAAKTGLTEEEVNDCLNALRMSRMTSWEALSEARQAEIVAPQPEESADYEEQKRLLVEGLTRLAERERLVVTLYYLEELRLKEIGAVLHLSESRVSRLLSAAIFNLGEYLRSRQED